MKHSSSLQSILFLVFAQSMVGINIVASKQLVASVPIFLLLIIRFSLATLLLLPLHWLTPSRQFSLRHHVSQLKQTDWLFIIAEALSAGALFNCLMLLGLHYTDANIAGIITSTLPAMIAILSWIVLGEKIAGKKSLCVIFASLGLLVIAWDKFHALGQNHSFVGDVIILLALLPEAAYYVLCQLHPRRLPVFLLSALMNAINAFILLPALFFTPHLARVSLQDGAILLILGLSTGLFYIFWYFGLQRVDGVMASLSTAVMPVATVILAWLILGEQLTAWQCAGMTMVILSIGLYARR